MGNTGGRKQISLSLPIAALCLVGLLALAASTVSMGLKYRRLVETFNERQMAVFPPKGEELIGLNGRTREGKYRSIAPTTSSKFLLLVFTQDCGFCETNWANWDRILGDKRLETPVFLVSSDGTISDTYQKTHPEIDTHPVLLAVSKTVMVKLKLDHTPQTILVEGGKVSQTWPGVLSARDISEIIRAAT